MGELLLFPMFGEDEDEGGPGSIAIGPAGGVPLVEVVERQPADLEARMQALDVRRSWIVEAPAGSGKTGLLIQRYLKLLGDEGVGEPEEILAITFTKAATEEIRERVLGELERAAALPEGAVEDGPEFRRVTSGLARRVLERDRRRGWRIREGSHRINVRTIDAVCAEIARSLPVLTRGAGRGRPRAEATGLYGEAARRTMLQMGGADVALGEALEKLLGHRDGNVADCEDLVAEMLRHRDQWSGLVPTRPGELTEEFLEAEVLPRLNRALEQAVCAVLSEIGRAMPAELLRRLSEAAGEMAHLEGYKGGDSPIAICAGMSEAPEETAEHLARWRALIHLLVAPSKGSWRRRFNRKDVSFETSKQEQERLKELVEEVQHRDDLLALLCSVRHLPPAVYPPEQWEVAKALFRVLSRAMEELEGVFAETGECDFAELAITARAALRDGGGGMGQIEAARGVGLRHLLIDEMQDTSTGQYELIGLLTRGWDGVGRTMFLVGDPKQSIYLFREARVERFVETMRTEVLGGVRLGRLQLTENFRSQAGLVDGINESFARVFPQPGEALRPEQVPFVAATAARPAAVGGEGEPATGVVWHTAVLPEGSGVQEAVLRRRQSRVDAEGVRALLEAWRARPLPEGRTAPWTAAVLVRARSDLRELLPVLKRGGVGGSIPFRAVEIDVLSERQEVLDLHALTRALLHPADRMAWLAVLRAPWCGLGMAELHLLMGGDAPGFRERTVMDLLSERGDLLGGESCARLERVWRVMEAAVGRSDLPVRERVERAWRSLGGDAALGDEGAANAERYLRMLGEVEATEGRVEIGELDRRMPKLYAEAGAEAGAVELMTIHKAKGLEWDVVLVPEMDRRSPHTRGGLLAWEELTSGDAEAAQVIVAPVAGKGEEAKALNKWISGLHRAREAAERKRMFYVAATRAREELHLFASVKPLKGGVLKGQPGSMLEAAWAAAEGHFRETAEATVIRFPAAAEAGVMDLAAGGESAEESAAAAEVGVRVGAEPVPATVWRLPVGFDPATRWRGMAKLPYGEEGAEEEEAAFARPEGSGAARSLGNAVHAFLEMAARRLAVGIATEALRGEVRGWVGRIEALLRADGVAPGAVGAMAREVLLAIEKTLADPVGAWVVGPRAGALTEAERTTWAARRRSIRVDRSFRAGSEPMAEGEESLWIVDYKTSTHGVQGMEAFLAGEREKYREQMETYARVLGGGVGVRVGLYYPMVGRMVWWVVGG